jgi:hypothetical protein
MTSESKKEYMRKWRRENPEKWHKTVHKANQKYRKGLRNKILTLLGNECANPYNIKHGDFLKDVRCLQIDHVNNNGRKETIKKSRTSYYLFVLKKIKSGSKDYQLLCANCNWLKEQERQISQKI